MNAWSDNDDGDGEDILAAAGRPNYLLDGRMHVRHYGWTTLFIPFR